MAALAALGCPGQFDVLHVCPPHHCVTFNWVLYLVKVLQRRQKYIRW